MTLVEERFAENSAAEGDKSAEGDVAAEESADNNSAKAVK